MKKSENKIIENKIALSFREYKDKKILFRLFNNKRDKTKSFFIYEKSKFSTNIEKAFKLSRFFFRLNLIRFLN